MKPRFFAAAAAFVLVGAGCQTAPPASVGDLPSAPPESAVMTDGSATSRKPYYVAYSPEVASSALAEGRPVVYYFWASWCPICRAEEPKVKGWIETSKHPIAGFRVDYDTESALKAEYRIPYQHTVVFLNAKGEEVERFNGPVEESEFRAALAKTSG